MTHFLRNASLLAALALGAASCTPNDKPATTDSTTDNAAAAADTVGAHTELAKDRAGVQSDSTGATLTDKTGGAGTSQDAATNAGTTR